MSVKYFNKEKNRWCIFPGTVGAPGKDAYLIAQENGYTGTKEEYTKVLVDIPDTIDFIKNADKVPTQGSNNLVLSGGTWQAIEDVNNKLNVIKENIENELGNTNSAINRIKIVEIPNQIQASIVNNLESSATDKSLSANQGRVLKEMITNLVNLQIAVVDQLPSIGETNIIYLVKKTGSAPDIHDEYVFVNNKWEKIGNTEVDLSNYYTKREVDEKGIAWNKITGKPNTFTPSTHTHPLSQITNAGALAYKDKVDVSDLNFSIPEGTAVDAELSTTSVNPVQNKIITVALNNKVDTSSLGNYYTKSETYSRTEIDNKISSAGGGDVLASGNLVTDYIIVGAGTKTIKNSGQTLSSLALKSEIPSLSGYATQNWVNTQGFVTENTWRPIKVGGTTLSNNSTTLTITNGAGIDLSFSNGVLTITNTVTGGGSGSSYTLPVAKDSVLGGIKTGYTESGGAEIAIYTLTDGTAYTRLKSTAISAALGYTPANASNIPTIPTSLPNPNALSIKANNTTTIYTGSSAASINLDNIFAKKFNKVTTPGQPGIFYSSATTAINVNQVYVTEDNPDAIIVVPSSTTVSFTGYQKMEGLDNLSGGSYKCYCITYVSTGVVLVNGAIYG